MGVFKMHIWPVLVPAHLRTHLRGPRIGISEVEQGEPVNDTAHPGVISTADFFQATPYSVSSALNLYSGSSRRTYLSAGKN